MRFSKFACCFAILFSACACFAQMYTVTDLGTLGGSSSVASGINVSGHAVGNSTLAATSSFHGFVFYAGTMTDLGTLGGLFSSASSINDSNQIVGLAQKADGNFHAFLYTDGQLTDLGTLGGQYSAAYRINSSGQISGDSETGSALQGFHAFLYSEGKMTDLGTLGGPSSEGLGLNGKGEVTGCSHTAIGDFHAFLSSGGVMTDIGTLGTSYNVSCGMAINDAGLIAGWSTFSANTNGHHAFLYTAGMMTDLGTLGGTNSVAADINLYGNVVGRSETASGASHAFLYTTGIMRDLNNLISSPYHWQYLAAANSIDNEGQIDGYGFTLNGEVHAFLLDPIYKASVQQPINIDGSSVFSSKRGVIPVKFAVTQYDTQPSCTLPATIAVTRTSGGTLAAVDESTYSMRADNGSNFRIDGCQYIYNLSASSLGVGTYRVDIRMNGLMIGHAVFALK